VNEGGRSFRASDELFPDPLCHAGFALGREQGAAPLPFGRTLFVRVGGRVIEA
jgi:hypothetical protein